jgi:Mrp family chromosome partitioning ATPase
MVEILLSLVLLVATAALALWPWVGIHDHTIDGLFLTLTGSVMFLLFLFHFIWQLRSQGAEEKIRIRNAWQQLAHGIAAKFSKGGKSMRTIPPRVTTTLVLGIVLLILGFPSSLYAGDLSIAQESLVPAHSQQVLAVSVPHHVGLRNREHDERRVLLMDADVRLRAAAAMFGNPTIEKAVEHADVPLRMIVLTATPMLEV